MLLLLLLLLKLKILLLWIVIAMIQLISKKIKSRKWGILVNCKVQGNLALLNKKLSKVNSKIYKIYKYIWNTFLPSCALTNQVIKNEFHLQNSLLIPYCYCSHYYEYTYYYKFSITQIVSKFFFSKLTCVKID